MVPNRVAPSEAATSSSGFAATQALLRTFLNFFTGLLRHKKKAAGINRRLSVLAVVFVFAGKTVDLFIEIGVFVVFEEGHVIGIVIAQVGVFDIHVNVFARGAYAGRISGIEIFVFIDQQSVVGDDFVDFRRDSFRLFVLIVFAAGLALDLIFGFFVSIFVVRGSGTDARTACADDFFLVEFSVAARAVRRVFVQVVELCRAVGANLFGT